MIAVAIGLPVEDGKVRWRDPVKKHLPWLMLHDKYAEEHVNIGDMLSMNSGFGAVSDIADMFGAFASEREYVEALQYLEPDHSLREKPDYANVNFVTLGQLIESVSGQTWYEFLKQRVWEPLGMKNTFASTLLAPSEGQAFTAGHFVYDGEVLGPFDITKDRETFLKVGMGQELNAAGSIVSCAEDMATFIRLLLNKGSVGDVKLLKSASTIAEMITGKVTATSTVAQVTKMGLCYDPDGSTLAAGYGIDLIGQSIWGYPYFDKSGDVSTQQTRTGFAPTEKLGVIFMANSQVPDPHASFYLDHYRTYVMGVFLDVPNQILDFEYQKLRAADQLQPPFPGAPARSLRFWEDLPIRNLPIRNDRADGDSQLTVTLALSSGPLYYLGEVEGMPSMKIFLGKFALGPAILPASVSPSGHYVFNVGISYQKPE
ncbi:hypothetical protein Poli38472_000800 [Pythium oligandrum]|uniref:Beta-lactamase-related domain-containing protein n=1 Tax=Pythium oligandrum TaxID=41045 RepID=A0A8K1CDU0_PYTOL|nr:hypothetical protein Poli38472_000800 [Pythium oligandrum]|eukprot:TMW60758.1 hypothetical protein Poli38472_000800 [Pythium oligandrum]